MADQDSILGTSGKDAIPYEYQAEQQRIARKRALAQAMMQKGMAGPRATQMFGIHASSPGVVEHLASALQTYMGQKRLGDADAEDLSMGRRMETERQGDMRGATELYGSDPRAAIAKAMSSRFGNVQGVGANWQKDMQARMMKQGELIGGADPVAGARYIQGNDGQAPIAPIPQRAPVFSTAPNGETVLTDYDSKGTGSSKFAPKGVSVSQTMGGKTDLELDKAGIAALEKSKAAVDDIPGQLSNIIRVNELSNKGATQGGGTSAIQAVRQFGNLFGVQVPETGMTTEMKMRLRRQCTLAR